MMYSFLVNQTAGVNILPFFPDIIGGKNRIFILNFGISVLNFGISVHNFGIFSLDPRGKVLVSLPEYLPLESERRIARDINSAC